MIEIIKNASFDHAGGFYFYRVHQPKVDSLCKELSNLKKYLSSIFNECPHAYFNEGPRSSKLKRKLNCDLIEIRGHEVSALARIGGKENSERYKTAHSRVQVFMLENDGATIATEVPIWITKTEFSALKINKPLTGHIDLLRIEDGYIWIWDYKPNAKGERYAATQVYFYALMLSKRTGIKLDRFRCGYFDEEVAYMFKPKEDSSLKRFF